MNIIENLIKFTSSSKLPTNSSNLGSQIKKESKQANGIFFIESEYGIENTLAYGPPSTQTDIQLQKFTRKKEIDTTRPDKITVEEKAEKENGNLTIDSNLSDRILHMSLKLKKKSENEYLLKFGRMEEKKAYLSNNNPYFGSEKADDCKEIDDLSRHRTILPQTPPCSSEEDTGGGSISLEYEVTHRGIFHFIPRHSDEIEIDRGDPIFVENQSSDLWGEGINLRTGHCGIFPLAYVIMDEEKGIHPEDDLKTDHFLMNYLGSVEVDYHKGNHVICQAMSKICLLRKMCTTCPIPICIIEIACQGVRILCKNSRQLRYNTPQRYYFPFYNISFCGYNPKDSRYFGFITKHPTEEKHACHVFIATAPTQLVVECIGLHFKNYYANYLQCIKHNTIIENLDED